MATQAVSPETPMDLELAASVNNESLLSLMNGDLEDTTDPDDAEERSPAKNKPRKLGTTVDPPKPAAEKNTVKSVLKTGFKLDDHVHNHPRVLAEASIQLKSDSPVQEFIVNLQELLKNGQLVDKAFAFCAVKDDGRAKKIRDVSGVPNNMTLLSAYFKISGRKGGNAFEKQKVFKNNKEVKGELRDPTIYFAFAFATDEDPEDVLARICHEWHRRGGGILKVKELQTFESETILCLFNILTLTPKKTILAEYKTILEQALDLAEDLDDMEILFDPNDVVQHSRLPTIELRQLNPKLPGQDTSHFNKLSWKAQASRKVFHVECDSRYSSELKRLTQLAKDTNLVKNMWGKHAHLSEVVDKDSTPSEVKRLMRVAQVHCNYQCSMLLEDITGITNLDAEADLYQDGVVTPLRFTLRMALLRFVKLSDGHRLFAEIHQTKGVNGRVQAVIPNTPEAEKMILMMNKNFPAYIGNSLSEQGLPEDFLLALLKKSCCPSMFSEMSTCTWDSDTGVLTTQREASEKADTKKLVEAPWFKDAFEDLALDAGEARKPLAPPPESLFNLDEDRSVKTIHDRNMNRLPSAGHTPPRKTNEIVQVASSDEDSASSSSEYGSRNATADGDDDAPVSSDEANGEQGATMGG
jgi:hypothetical protein